MESTDNHKGKYSKTKHYSGYQKKSTNKNFNNKNNRQQYDPYQTQMLLYSAEMYICTRYPNLIDLNFKNTGFSEKIKENSLFFVIKSFSEEDVHKAIKYKVWSSTKTGNQTLDTAFKMTSEKQAEVYLLYSCNGSGRFVGVAKMTSNVDEKNTFMYWTQDSKWSGLFDIDWIFIKDTPFKAFKNIDILMKDGQIKPVTYSRDTQEVPYTEAVKMMSIIENYVNTNTILEHFEYYDMRQENYEKTLQLSG